MCGERERERERERKREIPSATLKPFTIQYVFLNCYFHGCSECLLLLPLWESVIVLCSVIRYVMSILVLKSP